MKSIKAKIIYHNIIKPTYDLIKLFSINPGKSVKNSVHSSVLNSVSYSVQNSVYYFVSYSVHNSARKSIRDNIK